MPFRTLTLIKVALVALAVVLSGCASSPSANGSKAAPGESAEDAVARRAIERWEALIRRDAATAWTYLSPGYRSTHPQAKYAEEMNERPVRWFKVGVAAARPEAPSIHCDEAKTACTIGLEVFFKVRSHLIGVGVIESSNFIAESWIKSGKEWYLVPKDVL